MGYYFRYGASGEIHVVMDRSKDKSLCGKHDIWLDDTKDNYAPIYLPLPLSVGLLLSNVEILSDHYDNIEDYLNNGRYNDVVDTIHFNNMSMHQPRLKNHIMTIATAYNASKWTLITNDNELEEYAHRLPGAIRDFFRKKHISGNREANFEKINICGTCMSSLFFT